MFFFKRLLRSRKTKKKPETDSHGNGDSDAVVGDGVDVDLTGALDELCRTRTKEMFNPV